MQGGDTMAMINAIWPFILMAVSFILCCIVLRNKNNKNVRECLIL